MTIDQALFKAVEEFKSGDVAAAKKLFRKIIEIEPNHSDANNNMGIILVASGDLEEAVPFIKTALESNFNVAQYWFNYIDVLFKLGSFTEALKLLAVARDKGCKGQAFDELEEKIGSTAIKFEMHIERFLKLIAQGEIAKVLEESGPLLRDVPGSLSLLNVVSLANEKSGNFNAAVDNYAQILKVIPNSTEAYSNMGNALKAQGKLEEAIAAYAKALAIKPDTAAVYNNMGNALYRQGKLEKAIEAYTQAIAIKPDNAEALHNIVNALAGVGFKKPNPTIQKIITSLLDRKSFVRPSEVARAAISLLKFEPELKRHIKDYRVAEVEPTLLEAITDLSRLPLLLKLMSICPLADLDIENLFRKLRASLLLSIADLTGSIDELKFQSALALQCFTNEYIYNQSKNEDDALTALEAVVKQALSDGNQPSLQSILCLASYKPLNQYEWSNSLRITSEIQEVFTRQVLEPNQEAKLKAVIPVLEEITDEVSTKVRDQYEVSPYPRWVNLRCRPEAAPISKLVEELELRLVDDQIKEVEAPNILVAGCGTGQHSIGTASRFKGSKVLAVDLSLSSLSYAKRKTEELGVKNIDYMQADILHLGKLGRQFDIVESAGVLHHMNDPVAGWGVLTDCLKLGGLMKIGLYSELARQHIVEMRQQINKAGIGSNDVAMKSFRTSVTMSCHDHHKKILNSSDFYSLSSLKDLLFHVQEHRFTIPQINECLGELGLKFCGFETTLIPHFKQINTGAYDLYNLDKWQTYEVANPNAFAGMYQLWCQKIV